MLQIFETYTQNETLKQNLLLTGTQTASSLFCSLRLILGSSNHPHRKCDRRFERAHPETFGSYH